MGELFLVNVLFLSLDLSHEMTYLVPYILLLLRTPSNGSLRPICLIRSSLQYNFILVYYEKTVLLCRWTFDCNWRNTGFYCIVLYCIVQISCFCRKLIYSIMVKLRQQIV